MKLSILIPALNEEATIGQVIDNLPRTLAGVDTIDVIVVDDGSTDQTARIAREKGAIVIKHKKNGGVGRAFHSGMERSIKMAIDVMVTIDADGQFDPQEISKLIKPILDGEADMVTGSRFINKDYIPKNMPKLKKWGNHVMAKLISGFTKQKFHDVACGFRAYDKEAMLNLNLFGKFTYTQETFLELAYKGLHIVEVPVTVQYFEHRTSRVASNLFTYAYKTISIIVRTIKDYRPLKFFGLCGTMIIALGLCLNTFVFIHYLRYGSFSPFKILGFLGAFLSAVGIMIIFIGILADLIDKMRLTQEKILYHEKRKNYHN